LVHREEFIADREAAHIVGKEHGVRFFDMLIVDGLALRNVFPCWAKWTISMDGSVSTDFFHSSLTRRIAALNA
jgi:hypothetical protein